MTVPISVALGEPLGQQSRKKAMVAAQQEQEVSFLQWNLLQGAHLLLFDELQFSAQDGF